MKALSLTQPYAELIKNGTKTVETRSWKTNYRGILYIHASAAEIPKESRGNPGLMGLVHTQDLDYGKIICSCTLADCIPMTEAYVEDMRRNHPKEYLSGIYAPGRYAWILEEIKVLKEPIKIKGRLGLWSFEVP